MASIKTGDHVEWNTPQGPTQGKVTRRLTADSNIGSHTAKASKEHPSFEVQSDKSGKRAVHRPDALKKVR